VSAITRGKGGQPFFDTSPEALATLREATSGGGA
jgi:hypothetical protein